MRASNQPRSFPTLLLLLLLPAAATLSFRSPSSLDVSDPRPTPYRPSPVLLCPAASWPQAPSVVYAASVGALVVLFHGCAVGRSRQRESPIDRMREPFTRASGLAKGRPKQGGGMHLGSKQSINQPTNQSIKHRNLDEADVGRLLPEALAAAHQPILADYALLVACGCQCRGGWKAVR